MHIFYHPRERADLGLDIAKCQDKLDRCRRLVDKWKQIEAEEEVNRLQLFRSWGYTRPKFSELVDGTEDIEGAKKRCVKIIENEEARRSRNPVSSGIVDGGQ